MLFLIVFLAIIFVVGIVLFQNPKTKKIGLFIIISIAMIALIRYNYINHNEINSNIFNDNIEVVDNFNYFESENIVMILFFTSMAAFAASPFVFLTGLFLAIKGIKYRKMGLMFMIGSVIAFIVGINVCGQIHI